MSFNGSGTFVINSAGQPVVSGTVISSTAFNALTADLANGLSTCITKDGQTTPTADIPMGSNKITGLANGTAAGDAANLGQVQSTVAKLLGSVSGADTITAVGAPTVAAYAAGQMFYFVAAGANTGAVTINIDSLGAKNITRDGTTALAAGDIQSGEVCVIVYDGTQFQLVNGASQSASIVTENLTVNKATVLNESGGDNDTRIEGDTDANLLFVDASTDRVGVGTSSPGAKLDVSAPDGTAPLTLNSAGGSDATRALNFNIAGDNYGKILVPSGSGGAMAFWTGAANAAAERARIDTSGNLGLGVTPSAWSAITALQVKNAFFGGASNSAYLGANAYYDGSVFKYIATGFANRYQQDSDGHLWFTAPSGTAGDPITFSQAMTLTAAGNLGVGTTSPYSTLAVSGNITLQKNASNVIQSYTGAAYTNLSYDAAVHIWGTSGTERARITSGGELLVGTTSNIVNANAKLQVVGTEGIPV
jgi:hypothetical protein